MSAAAKRQDMPPAGGYKTIPYIRNPAKSYFNGIMFKFVFILVIVIKTVNVQDISALLPISVSRLLACTCTIWRTKKSDVTRLKCVPDVMPFCPCWWPNVIENIWSKFVEIAMKRPNSWLTLKDGRWVVLAAQSSDFVLIFFFLITLGRNVVRWTNLQDKDHRYLHWPYVQGVLRPHYLGWTS